jgi:CHAT domain-containing protein
VEEIVALLPAARVVRGARVAEVSELLADCDAVHVASHGAFQPLIPSGSGIRLNDGWLTALDILRSPVRARLVSLGACASGEIEVAPGEEIAGIVRALLASGVQAAVVAPGALDDLVARRAARMFYEGALANGAGAALRHTLLALRDEFDHPALWAGLQLYGNPRPWEDPP